ncbi:addiction module HigA family antidote, partial [Novispirillum itersonii]
AAADADTTKRRKEIAAVLDTLSDQTRRVEIKPSLENKATELRQITMRRSVTVRNLLFYSPWPLSRTPWTTGRTIWSALRQPPGNRLEALKGNRERHSTESGSMTRGGSASAGVRATPKTWKSWTITKARRHPMLAPTPPVHPGEILREEFMQPLGLTAYAVAQACHVPRTRIERLFRLETPVTADTTLRLGRAFGTGPEFWMNLQALYDLGSTMPDDLDQVRPLVAAK